MQSTLSLYLLTLEAFTYSYDQSIASLYVYEPNLSKKVLRIAYLIIRK